MMESIESREASPEASTLPTSQAKPSVTAQPVSPQPQTQPTRSPPQVSSSSSGAGAQINVPLTTLISEMQRTHKHRMGQLKDAAEANFKTASASTAAACQSLVDVSNTEVIEIFNAETKIEAQIKEVSVQTEQLHKRMTQWAQLFVKFNRSLKEIGDVQHWTQMIEVDMEETVRILEALSVKKRQLVGIQSS
ncbi:Hypothetical protein, putative [Bodo saltans]|uniref:Biogenesis of lysosome-related organelles complex 1 subunit 1 n=1 Tax=Bodo saltans TaxID=75058 RepID=A0A0S4KJG6_BODSA|nr:Hypothetical protein, putative [Bodo saltans]|eukprot:CUI14680.1 Hypothetical protein, putative [Bodo saltans]